MGLIPDRLHQHPPLQVEEKFPSHFCLPRGFHETKHLWFLLERIRAIRTATLEKSMSAIASIPFPQSCCSGCSRIGTGIDPYRSCRCLEPYVTIHSPREYRALAAKAHPPGEPSLTRSEASMPGWSMRRAG